MRKRGEEYKKKRVSPSFLLLEKTQVRLPKNSFTFDLKRKGVWF